MDKKRIVFSNSSASAVACCKKRMTAVIDKEIERVKMVENALTAALKQQANTLRKEIADEVKNAGRIASLSHDLYSDAGHYNIASFLRRNAGGGNLRTDGVAFMQSLGGNMVKNLVDGMFGSGCSLIFGKSEQPAVVNGVVRLSGEQPAGGRLFFESKLFPGHIYYCAVSVCSLGGKVGFSFAPSGSENCTVEISDSWCRYSSCVAVQGGNLQAFEISYSGDAAECLCYSPLVVDLTDFFGAGSEPSKEKCDAMYSVLPPLSRGITVADPRELKSVGYNKVAPSCVMEKRNVVDRYMFVAPCDINKNDELELVIEGVGYVVLFDALQGCITEGSEVELSIGDNSGVWVDGNAFQVSIAEVLNFEESDIEVAAVRRLVLGENSVAVINSIPAIENNGYQVEGAIDGKLFFTPLNPMDVGGELFLQKIILNEENCCNLPDCAGYLLVETKDIDNLCVHAVRDGKRKGYEKYRESVVTFPVIAEMSSYGLARVGDNYDTVDFVKWQYIKCIGRVVLNGTENWLRDTAGNGFYCDNLLPAKALSDVAVCDSNLIVQAGAPDYGTFSVVGNGVRLNHSAAVNSCSVKEFKSLLSQNPITIYYVLFTPEVYPIIKKVPVDYLCSAYGSEEFGGSELPLSQCEIYYMRSVASEIIAFFDALQQAFDSNDMTAIADKIAGMVLSE